MRFRAPSTRFKSPPRVFAATSRRAASIARTKKRVATLVPRYVHDPHCLYSTPNTRTSIRTCVRLILLFYFSHLPLFRPIHIHFDSPTPLETRVRAIVHAFLFFRPTPLVMP